MVRTEHRYLPRVQQRRVDLRRGLVHESLRGSRVSCTVWRSFGARARGDDARPDDGFEALEDCRRR